MRARFHAPSVSACVLSALSLACTSVDRRDAVGERGGERLTIDWMYSADGKRAGNTYETWWTTADTILLFDRGAPSAERTFELYDAATRTRRPLVDRERALASLAAARDEERRAEDPIEALSWPERFDADGTHGVWVIDDDLFVMELATSTFTRLTNTPVEEKSPRFSPDGQSIAYVRQNDLWTATLDGSGGARLTGDGSKTLLNGTLSWVYWEEIFGREDLGYWWSPDSRSIAFLQSDESEVPLVVFPDFRTPIPEIIEQRYPKTGSPNPTVRAGILDVDEATITWIDLGDFDYEYLARVVWLPGSEELAVVTLDRSQTHVDLFRVDARTGASRHVLQETDPAWVNLHDDLVFLDGGERFLWASERTGYAHLYLYSKDGEELARVTSGDWALRTSGGIVPWVRRSIANVDEAAGEVYYTSLEESSIEKHLYRVSLPGADGSAPAKERLTREAGTHVIRFSPSGKYYLDELSTIETPPALRLHAASGEELATLAEPRTELLEPFDLPAPELTEIRARDGFAMPAHILWPDGFDRSREYPVVFYVYGGPSAPTVSNSWRGRSLFENVLAQEGFVVVRVDNRSATAKSKALENIILEEGYGKRELSDLLDAVRWVKSQSWCDPDRVGIWGWSGGGSFTQLALTSTSEFAAGVSVAGVSDWRYYDTRWAEAFMKRPVDNPRGYDATSHAQRAKNLHGRLLLVHGTYDDNVHPQNTWRFADELIAADKRFEMMIYPMRKHGIADDAARVHLYKTMLEFWQRNL